MAASLKDKRTPITTPPYQVPSVDVTPDPPIFSLVTTFKSIIYRWCRGLRLDLVPSSAGRDEDVSLYALFLDDAEFRGLILCLTTEPRRFLYMYYFVMLQTFANFMVGFLVWRRNPGYSSICIISWCFRGSRSSRLDSSTVSYSSSRLSTGEHSQPSDQSKIFKVIEQSQVCAWFS